MGYTKTYNYHEDQREAINDLIRYVGWRRAKILIRYAKSGATDDQVFIAASFAGVTGYPVGSLIRYIQQRKG